MAKFCTNCGKPLEEGKVCECQIARQNQLRGAVPMHLPAKGPVRTWINNMFGLHEADLNDATDCYERGKKIVPDVLATCDDEVPVRQYHLVNFRSRLEGLWAEGRLQVTNKRVIFRASGRSLLGRTTMQNEYTIDEITGINISQGIRFGKADFLLCLLLLLPILLSIVLGLGVGMSEMLDAGEAMGGVFFVLALLFIIPFFVLKKYFLIKGCASVLSMGSFISAGIGFDENGFVMFLALLPFILAIVSFFFYALKPSMSICISCKSGIGDAVSITSKQVFKLQAAREIIPTLETAQAIKEIGSMITDIQEKGDYGIQKWKRD